jgi:23S rRNA (cytidine1920-2'-O)/16S rRNA (cytidine1409-2'-O)-methyltransferase
VYAVDVGYGQLDYSLRRDSRVVVMERVNARYLQADDLPEACDLITVDVSFISLVKVVPALVPHLAEGGRLLTLVKPQFEAPRGSVGKGGILRDVGVRLEVVERRVTQLEALGLRRRGVLECPVPGVGGNVEHLALFDRDETRGSAE